jgi:hypothetical protein
MSLINFIMLVSAFWNGFAATPQDPQYWIRLTTPTIQNVNRIAFPDTMNGWAACDSGVILHTSNGGTNWAIQNTTLYYPIQDIFFINSRLGWGIANDYLYQGTTILKTTNGGNNWNITFYPDSTLILNTVYFLDSLNGYMGGYQGVILKTTNAGANWTRAHIENNNFNFHPILRFSFYNSQKGVAAGGVIDAGGPVWKTTDSGYNWSVCDTSGVPIFDIRYIDANTLYGTGGEFDIGSGFIQSTNNGNTWTFVTLPYLGLGKAIALRTRSEIWIPLGFSQKWAVSYDSTKTWQIIDVPDSQAIFDAYFMDSTHGWAGGSNGAMYKFNNSLLGIRHPNNSIPVQYKLFQNFPNPFNPSTIISYDVPELARVRIAVFDVQGKVIKILEDRIREPGKYTLVFNGSELSSGIYFYKLSVYSSDGGAVVFSAAKKMVLIK